jgi:hypothetical protein
VDRTGVDGVAHVHVNRRAEALNRSDGIFADHTSYFASGSGRTWKFTILDLEPLPPS